jgi:hypothetical protein
MNVKNSKLIFNIDLYKRQIQKLDTEGIKRIFTDRSDALKFAKEGIEKIDPQNHNNEDVDSIANEMQLFARLLFEERRKLINDK